MKSHTSIRSAFARVGWIVVWSVVGTLPLLAQTPKPAPEPAPKTAAIATVTTLERLLPTLPGWTRGRTNSSRIDLSESCAYNYADAVYTNGTMKVRITLADTAGDPAALAVLATMVVTLADDYSTTIDKTTTVKRIAFNGSPAAMRWDAATLDGEFIVVLGGRFVAKAEGTGVENGEALRALVEHVDLAALAALK